jgi:hypothetical protein
MRRANGAGPGRPFQDEFDPEELFNMFFNGGFGAGGFGPARSLPHCLL